MSITITGATAALKAAREATRGNTVTEDTLRGRISICNTCPKRERIKGVVGSVGRVLAFVANKHKVPKEISGYRCGVCSCPLALLATALPENLHRDSPEEAAQRPGRCWLTEATKDVG